LITDYRTCIGSDNTAELHTIKYTVNSSSVLPHVIPRGTDGVDLILDHTRGTKEQYSLDNLLGLHQCSSVFHDPGSSITQHIDVDIY